MTSSRMESEAEEAAQVAERQLRGHPALLEPIGATLRALDPQMVVTCARGSSDHAATFAKFLIETQIGIPVASHSPSISSIYDRKWRGLDRSLFLAVSQSGKSPDLVVSAEGARQAGAACLAIVNAEGSPLEAACGTALPILAGAETSVAATKSYIGTLLATIGLVSAWSGRSELVGASAAAPEALRRAWALDWSPALEVLSTARNLFVIGRGSTFGIAQEAALKLKETCGLHAEAFSAAEVQHGPMAIIGEGFPLLLFAPQDEARASVEPLAADLVARGARLVTIGLEIEGAVNLPTVPGLHPALAPVTQILSFYRMAAALSRARGLDPDAPPYLRKVTETR